MKMTIEQVVAKLDEITDSVSAMDRISDEYDACSDAADLLCEYKSLILRTEIDL